MTPDLLIQIFKSNYHGTDVSNIHRAFRFVSQAFKGQVWHKEPAPDHCLRVAEQLASMKMPLPMILAGLFHDIKFSRTKNIDDIKKEFGDEVKKLVEGVEQLSRFSYHLHGTFMENMKKIFAFFAEDLRPLFIKFADRLVNLQTLDGYSREEAVKLVEDTWQVHIPLADAFGMWRIKWQMEDICFKFDQPAEYDKLEKKFGLEQKRLRESIIKKTGKELSTKLKKQGIKYLQINGRFKHYYSIYKKIQKKGLRFNEVYDVFALRVITDSADNCYRTLGVIHNLWKPKPKKFKDYIAVPKPNGYQSLHTVVFGPDGRPIEFQIRTEEMNDHAQYGLAANFFYKHDLPTKQLKWLNEVMKFKKNSLKDFNSTGRFQFSSFVQRIFVYTPKGDVIDLPVGATPLDFAYHIHTRLGEYYDGAKVNDLAVAMDYQLNNGDIVEIILAETKIGPQKSWLEIAKSTMAKNKIRNGLRVS